MLFSLCLESSAISAKSVIAVECDDFGAYYESGGYEKREIASVTKIMTAVIVLEHCTDRTMVLDVPAEAVGVEGSSIYIKQGERLSVDELLWALLLNSANDAAVALAIHVSGSVDAFVELMNLKAKALCMNDTVYKTPHGLSTDGQYSTAHDQAILACYAISVNGFVDICSSYTHSISYEGVPGGRYLVNHNKLLKKYEGCFGMKTGYTKAAGRCLVSCAERNGVTLVCVTLCAPNDWEDHIKLFDMGFNRYLN